MKIDGKILTIYQPNKEIIDLGSIQSLYVKDCILTNKGAVDRYFDLRHLVYKCFGFFAIIFFFCYLYVYWNRELTRSFQYLEYPILNFVVPTTFIFLTFMSLLSFFGCYFLLLARNVDRVGQAVMAKLSSNKTIVLFTSTDEETFDNVFTEIEKAMKNGFHEGYEFFED